MKSIASFMGDHSLWIYAGGITLFFLICFYQRFTQKRLLVKTFADPLTLTNCDDQLLFVRSVHQKKLLVQQAYIVRTSRKSDMYIRYVSSVGQRFWITKPIIISGELSQGVLIETRMIRGKVCVEVCNEKIELTRTFSRFSLVR